MRFEGIYGALIDALHPHRCPQTVCREWQGILGMFDLAPRWRQ
jgi:hypothetical protein